MHHAFSINIYPIYIAHPKVQKVILQACASLDIHSLSSLFPFPLFSRPTLSAPFFLNTDTSIS